MFDRLDDTIVAISSPAGVGVRGVIRMSGPDTFPIAGAVFTGEQDLQQSPGHRRIDGRVAIGESGTVPAEAYVFRAPASYTRQDVVELHTIGSPPLLAELFDQLVHAGARPAEAGEFTARAYFNGALDLTRVEGVAAAIHAQSDAQLRASEALLHGDLSKRTYALRERLADLLALIEAQIDFVDEPIEFIAPAELTATIQSVADDLEAMMAAAPEMERLEMLPEVLLVGPPNAGKSTLFNALTGLDRAIRSATAGTTRDVLRAPLALPGGEVMLSDTAGLDAALAHASQPANAPAHLAQDATRRALRSADLILLLIDATQPVAAAAIYPTLPASRTRIVLNKIDAAPAESAIESLPAVGITAAPLPVSALTGEGLDQLRAAISETLFGGVATHGSELLALTHRQRATIEEAAAALRRAREITAETQAISNVWELIAIEVRDAMHALSLLTGEVSTEELLTRIFSRFCIGK